MINGNPLVIFAEDNDDIRSLQVKAAQVRGWQGVGVATARELINTVNTLCPQTNGSCAIDCIVADIEFREETHTPRLTGITAIDAIRKRYPGIPVVYYSAYISALNKILIRKQGQGISYLEKPSDMRDLLDRIQAAMNIVSIEHKFEGEERRSSSINRFGYDRRVTDRPAEVPRVVEEALQSARTKAS
jgi:CheY-like chemotaxis protein